MRYLWIAIIAASAAPLLYVGMLVNPFFVVFLGIDGWRERMARLHPYRRWIVFLVAVCAFSVAVYTARYS